MPSLSVWQQFILRRWVPQRWPGESAQGDKWKPCLKAASIAVEQEHG
jgi:hypothetical protein